MMDTRNRGIVLLLVSIMLTVLLFVGMLMVSVSRVKTDLGTMTIHSVKARLLGSSGVECAIARLSRDIGLPFPPDSANAMDDWRYRQSWVNIADLKNAQNPSYNSGESYIPLGLDDGVFDINVESVSEDSNGNGVYDGYSGRLRGTRPGMPGGRGKR